MAKQGERLEEASRIRDAALERIRSEGTLSEIRGFGPALRWEQDGVTMLHITPLQKVPEPNDPVVRQMLAAMPDKAEFPYWLDIWDAREGGKVFSMRWNGDGAVRIIRFRRGVWEYGMLGVPLIRWPDEDLDADLPF